MWLRLTFRWCVKVTSTQDMIYVLFVFYKSLHIIPQNYLGYFVQGQLHLPTTQSLLWRQDIKLEVLLGFENFQVVAHGFLGCQFLENIFIEFFILASCIIMIIISVQISKKKLIHKKFWAYQRKRPVTGEYFFGFVNYFLKNVKSFN